MIKLPSTNLQLNVTHSLSVIGKHMMRLHITKSAMSLACCLSKGKDVIRIDCLSQNLQCPSLAVYHMKKCDDTAFRQIFNLTHSLLVIGKDVMILPSTKFSNGAYILSEENTYIEQFFRNICNVTHIL
jgi:hypothetical protein